jgi:hypothetical protein
MKVIAPGSVVFHRYRGYGVIMAVNLLTGWVSVRFGSESRTLDLSLSSDEVLFADGTPILFRKQPPERMPHARLMDLVRCLHRAGYQKLYLYTWPKASGLHWRWHLFTGTRNWMHRPWRAGWFGSGADYNVNPVMGWGDSPGASTDELIAALAQFDPEGLAQALGKDEDHTQWFAAVCDALLPDYAFSLGLQAGEKRTSQVPVISVKSGLPPYAGPHLTWPPGWERLWPSQGDYLLQTQSHLTGFLMMDK